MGCTIYREHLDKNNNYNNKIEIPYLHDKKNDIESSFILTQFHKEKTVKIGMQRIYGGVLAHKKKPIVWCGEEQIVLSMK